MRIHQEAAIIVALAACAGFFAPVSVAQTVHRVAAAQPPVKDEIFAGVEKFSKGASDVTDINLGPEELSMLGGSAASGLAGKVKFVIVHDYTFPQAGMYKMEDIDSLRQKLESGDWKCILHDVEPDHGEVTDICLRPAADHNGTEFALIDAEPKELTFIDASGNVSLSDLSKLGSLENTKKSTPSTAQPQHK